ncbi:hypothetical protein BKA80DRAFT_305932 [Phyllosticta citrichinensis]
MSTALAASPAAPPPAPADHAHAHGHVSPRNTSTMGLSPNSNPQPARSPSAHSSPTTSEGSHKNAKRSPNSTRNTHAPKIVVKKEPSSPDMPASRHRPRRLDLSNNMSVSSATLSARPSAPLTGKESAGLAMHDVGLACLSPGFHTQDPAMREQLQRSIDVRDRQRQIIEARQKGKNTQIEVGDASRHDGNPFRKMPASSRRKGPPPGLSIATPSAQQFANERVIQSAPLNQSFTGMRAPQFQALSRQVANQPSNLSQTSHIHHVPANQTNNRLPPISDVFAGEALAPQRRSPGHAHSAHQHPLPSPGFPHNPHGHPQTARPREHRSAEEALQHMAGGRDDLLPRIVHYGGHQPPTPPSPMPGKSQSNQNLQPGAAEVHRSSSSSSRRRTREEYERDMGTPPLGRQERRPGPFGEGRDSPETQKKKKEEFIALCARAWDLFHS